MTGLRGLRRLMSGTWQLRMPHQGLRRPLVELGKTYSAAERWAFFALADPCRAREGHSQPRAPGCVYRSESKSSKIAHDKLEYLSCHKRQKVHLKDRGSRRSCCADT